MVAMNELIRQLRKEQSEIDKAISELERFVRKRSEANRKPDMATKKPKGSELERRQRVKSSH